MENYEYFFVEYIRRWSKRTDSNRHLHLGRVPCYLYTTFANWISLYWKGFRVIYNKLLQQLNLLHDSFLLNVSFRDALSCLFFLCFPTISWIDCSLSLAIDLSERRLMLPLVKLLCILLRSPDFSLLSVTLKAHFKIKCYSKVKSLCQEQVRASRHNPFTSWQIIKTMKRSATPSIQKVLTFYDRNICLQTAT